MELEIDQVKNYHSLISFRLLQAKELFWCLIFKNKIKKKFALIKKHFHYSFLAYKAEYQKPCKINLHTDDYYFMR